MTEEIISPCDRMSEVDEGNYCDYRNQYCKFKYPQRCKDFKPILKVGDFVKFNMGGEIIKIKGDIALVVSGNTTWRMQIKDLELQDLNGNDSTKGENHE